MPGEAPVAVQASTEARSEAVRCAYSLPEIPVNTPVRVPASDPGAMPACWRASQAVSRSSRCCGSMAAASPGAMPKNSASNPATSSRNPPCLVTPSRAAPVRAVPSSNASHRPSGTSPTASSPPISSSQYAAGPCAPGKRQPTPITATGSAGVVEAGTATAAVPGVGAVGVGGLVAVRAGIKRLIVGWSHRRVGLRSRPTSSPNSPVTATASRDDSPYSPSGRSGSTCSPSRDTRKRRSSPSPGTSMDHSHASGGSAKIPTCPGRGSGPRGTILGRDLSRE